MKEKIEKMIVSIPDVMGNTAEHMTRSWDDEKIAEVSIPDVMGNTAEPMQQPSEGPVYTEGFNPRCNGEYS